MGEIVKKKLANSGNTFLTKQNNNVIWHDADIILCHGYNSGPASGREIEIQFNVLQDWVLSQHTMGDNQFKVKEEYGVDKTKKNISNGEDNNGGINIGYYTWGPSYYKFSNPELIGKIVFETFRDSNQRWTYGGTIFFSNRMINLKTIIANKEFSSVVYNFDWLLLIPSIEDIRFSLGTGTNYAPLFYTSLKYINLRLASGSAEDIVSKMPNSLNYLNLFMALGSGTTLNLASYFKNTNRMGLLIANRHDISLANLTYPGGGIFPTAIVEEPDRPIDWILRIDIRFGTFLSPTDAARFIVDFANQVTSVTLANKRIHFNGTVPDSSYTDPSKSIYKNYIDAYNYVTATLGITIY